MLIKRTLVATFLAVLHVVVNAHAQAAKPIDYETFCKLDAAAKKEAFNLATAENRGTLARTQLERWRDANQTRLDEKQKAVLAELIQSITSESYSDGPQGEAARTKTRAIVIKFELLFTRSDMMAMQPDAPCIAKKVKDGPEPTGLERP